MFCTIVVYDVVHLSTSYCTNFIKCISIRRHSRTQSKLKVKPRQWRKKSPTLVCPVNSQLVQTPSEDMSSSTTNLQRPVCQRKCGVYMNSKGIVCLRCIISTGKVLSRWVELNSL